MDYIINRDNVNELVYILRKKKLTVMREYDANRRVPDPEFVDHYEFELEVLAVNTTERVKIFIYLHTYIHRRPCMFFRGREGGKINFKILVLFS